MSFGGLGIIGTIIHIGEEIGDGLIRVGEVLVDGAGEIVDTERGLVRHLVDEFGPYDATEGAPVEVGAINRSYIPIRTFRYRLFDSKREVTIFDDFYVTVKNEAGVVLSTSNAKSFNFSEVDYSHPLNAKVKVADRGLWEVSDAWTHELYDQTDLYITRWDGTQLSIRLPLRTAVEDPIVDNPPGMPDWSSPAAPAVRISTTRVRFWGPGPDEANLSILMKSTDFIITQELVNYMVSGTRYWFPFVYNRLQAANPGFRGSEFNVDLTWSFLFGQNIYANNHFFNERPMFQPPPYVPPPPPVVPPVVVPPVVPPVVVPPVVVPPVVVPPVVVPPVVVPPVVVPPVVVPPVVVPPVVVPPVVVPPVVVPPADNTGNTGSTGSAPIIPIKPVPVYKPLINWPVVPFISIAFVTVMHIHDWHVSAVADSIGSIFTS
jgi:hypothetical protein